MLLALAAVIALGQILAWLFAKIHQPPVIGEVVAGILLGPSLIGREWSAAILPPAAESYLGLVAQLGAILYMFIVGLEMNASRLRHRAHATLSIAHASMLVPFLLGSLLALPLYPRFVTADVPFTSFALFMGLALSITAFPVLARILTDRQMTHTELGAIALGAAAINDVTAWCMLAFVVGLARAEGSRGLAVAGSTLAYVAAMLFLVRPLATRWALTRNDGPPPRSAVAIAFVALLLSALATEWIGIHALFGAFLLGAIIPHDSPVAKELSRQARAGHDCAAPARVLRLHRHAHADRPRLRPPSMAPVRRDHRGRGGGQIRRSIAHRPPDRPFLAALRSHRHPHEHPRTDGANRA